MPRTAFRLILASASIAVLSLAAGIAPAGAEGPVYAVPSHPPPVKESVDFTNDLNQGKRDLPAPLDPPVASTPEEVEARIRVLERGVVVEKKDRQPNPQSGDADGSGDAGAGEGEGGTAAVEAAVTDDSQPPLSVAFVGAGALALLGLLLSARGWRTGRAPEPRP